MFIFDICRVEGSNGAFKLKDEVVGQTWRLSKEWQGFQWFMLKT